MEWRPDRERRLVSAASLWITSRYICHVSPAHGGSNGAPWPGLCALLSVLWKSPKDSRQKHILTYAADIHLAPDTAGSDLSPLLNNNMVDRDHSARLSSSSTHTHTHTDGDRLLCSQTSSHETHTRRIWIQKNKHYMNKTTTCISDKLDRQTLWALPSSVILCKLCMKRAHKHMR